MTNDELEAEVKRLTTLATGRRYMMEAYRNMLGPKGLEVAAAWEAKRVHRVHYDWGPKAGEMSGEERAQFILDMEKQLENATPVEFVDDDELSAIDPASSAANKDSSIE